MGEEIWQDSVKNVVLLPDEVHVWRANLDLSPITMDQLSCSLSQDEIVRANRFRFPQHRKRFIAARGILRQLLSNYLKLESDRIVFEYSPQGKPQLLTSSNSSNLQFNISHSEDWALYSFCLQRKIGIDLEYIKDIIEYESIAQRFFCPEELQLITSCAKEKQKQVFFQLWTAKEAYLKATGKGLSGSLNSIQFSLNHQGEVNLISDNKHNTQLSNWFVYNFVPVNSFTATVAVESYVSPELIKFFSY